VWLFAFSALLLGLTTLAHGHGIQSGSGFARMIIDGRRRSDLRRGACAREQGRSGPKAAGPVSTTPSSSVSGRRVQVALDVLG